MSSDIPDDFYSWKIKTKISILAAKGTLPNSVCPQLMVYLWSLGQKEFGWSQLEKPYKYNPGCSFPRKDLAFREWSTWSSIPKLNWSKYTVRKFLLLGLCVPFYMLIHVIFLVETLQFLILIHASHVKIEITEIKNCFVDFFVFIFHKWEDFFHHLFWWHYLYSFT